MYELTGIEIDAVTGGLTYEQICQINQMAQESLERAAEAAGLR